MVRLRSPLALLFVCLATSSLAQSASLPNAPEPSPGILLAVSTPPEPSAYSSSLDADPPRFSFNPAPPQNATPQSQSHPSGNEPDDQPGRQPDSQTTGTKSPKPPPPNVPLDTNGNPIPLDRQQPARILGFIPNFRSVSVGANAPPPGWKNSFVIATHQAFDYSSFYLLSITSITAEGFNEHPSLGKGVPGFYAYTWRGFIDKTDGNYLCAWLLPSLLHEDTRYYPLGNGHSIAHRILYVIDRQAIALNYSGTPTPNIANLGGKALTQLISQYYYPDGSSSRGVLIEKFGYSVMRDVGFSAIREFYPDVAAHYVRKYHEKLAREAARDAQTSGVPPTSDR
jgi:hypothetical protein